MFGFGSDMKSVVIKIRADITSSLESLRRLDRQIHSTKTAAMSASQELKLFIGKTLAGIGVGKILADIVNATREFEVLSAGLVTATGSAQGAAEAFGELEKFAETTPYSLQQAVQGFTQLVNLGLTPSQEALRSYGNTAAALGKDLSQMIEAVADAATGEFERLKEFGIKASTQGDKVKFVFQGVTTTVQKNAAEIEKYLINIGNVNFAGAMEKRMATLDGKLSNLGDSWEKLQRSIGQNGLGEAVSKSVQWAIDALDNLNAALNSGEFQAGLDAMLTQFKGWAEAFGEMSDTVSKWFTSSMSDVEREGNETSKFLAEAFRHFGSNTLAFLQVAANGLFFLWDSIKEGANITAKSVTAIFSRASRESIQESVRAISSGWEAMWKGIDDAVAAAEKRNRETDEKLRERERLRQERQKGGGEGRVIDLAKFGRGAKSAPGAPSAGKAGSARLDDGERYVRQLERQAAVLGMTAAQVRAYELAERKLTGALKQRAEAALATLDADEKKKLAEENAKKNAGLQAELLRAQGRESDAALLELERKYNETLNDLERSGNEAGKKIIEQLFPVERAKIRLDEMRGAVDRAMRSRSRDEQSINAQVNAGLITQAAARERLLELNRQTTAVVERYLLSMEQAAKAIGPEAVENVRALREELSLSLEVSDDLAPLWEDIGQGFGDALSNTITGTETWRDSLINLFRQVSNAFLQHIVIKPFKDWVAAQAKLLAMKMGFAQQEQAMDMAISTKKVGQKIQEAGTVVSANAAEAGSGAANSVANIPYVGPVLAVAAMATVFAAVMALMGRINKFSTGGLVRGKGTGTSDSIPAWLSDYEHVTRSAVVRQPGALEFLTDFNERGMAALHDWSLRLPKHSTGGLAGFPAPSFPSPVMPTTMRERVESGSTTVNNAVNLHVYDDPQRIADAAFNTKQGQDNFYLMLSRDPARVRSVLGI